MSDQEAGIELSEAFKTARALRVPLWSRAGDVSTADLAEELAEFMLLSAYYAGELADERLDHYITLRRLQGEWDHLEGWEMFRTGKTDSSRDEAKRVMRPELWDELATTKWIIARLSEEIDRLNRDAEKAVSRTYTMLTGT